MADIISKVTDYVMGDDAFFSEFETFSKENCGIFEDSEENKLEYTTVFNKYTSLFNDRLEGFITSNGSTLEEFVQKCEGEGEESFALQLILGLTSFDVFKQLMLEQKEKLKEEAQ